MGGIFVLVDWDGAGLYPDLLAGPGDWEICLRGTMVQQTACSAEHGMDSAECLQLCIFAEHLSGRSVCHY
ncbi:hypothetical protein D3C76_1661890 [compost metagenome]